MVHVIAMEVLPEERDRKYYADSYSCCPPPLFILLITIIEVRFYQVICIACCGILFQFNPFGRAMTDCREANFVFCHFVLENFGWIVPSWIHWKCYPRREEAHEDDDIHSFDRKTYSLFDCLMESKYEIAETDKNQMINHIWMQWERKRESHIHADN